MKGVNVGEFILVNCDCSGCSCHMAPQFVPCYHCSNHVKNAEDYEVMEHEIKSLKKQISCYSHPLPLEARTIEEWRKCSLFWESTHYFKRDILESHIQNLEECCRDLESIIPKYAGLMKAPKCIRVFTKHQATLDKIREKK